MKTKAMTHSLFSQILTLLFFIVLTFLFSIHAGAETKEVTVTFTNTEYPANDIQTYLNMAKEDPANEYHITVPPGSYKLGSNGLHIYSNTHLYMEGVTIKRTAITGIGAIMMIGYPLRETKTYGVWLTSNSKGYYWGKYSRGSNIQITGGTFDAGTSTKNVTTLFTFSHVQDVTFEHVTFRYKPQKKTDKHMIEFAAGKNITIIGCTFDGNKNCGEAIQIESAIKGVGNFVCKGPSDGTKTSNVTIKNNIFRNFEYGVGTNHGSPKDVYKNFAFLNNSFESISKYAICTYNYTNCKISGNVLKKGSKQKFEQYVLKLGSKNSLSLKSNRIK